MEEFFKSIKDKFTNATYEFETVSIKVDSSKWIEIHEQLKNDFNLNFFS